MSARRGSTFDPNGIHVFTRSTIINGSVVNGIITILVDSGPIVSFATPTPGELTRIGEVGAWEIFAFAGRGLTVTANPGGPTPPAPLVPPALGWVEIEIADSRGIVIARADKLADGPGSLAQILGGRGPLPRNVAGVGGQRRGGPGSQGVPQEGRIGKAKLGIGAFSLRTRRFSLTHHIPIRVFVDM